jgi:hypothetical protein
MKRSLFAGLAAEADVSEVAHWLAIEKPKMSPVSFSAVRSIVDPVGRTLYTGYKIAKGTIDLAQGAYAAARGDSEGVQTQVREVEDAFRAENQIQIPWLLAPLCPYRRAGVL